MGTFRVPIEIGAPAGSHFEKIDALVDTESTYTWVSREVLDRLGVRPVEQRPFILADGRQATYPIAWIQIRMEGRTQPTIAVFGEPASDPLLGVFTLEGFGFAADPINRRLAPVPALLK